MITIKRRYSYLMGLALLAQTGAALAADDDGNFGLRGLAAENCGSALQQIQSDEDAALHLVSWFMGYMTAVNRARPDTFDASPIVDGAAMMQLLVNTCAANQDISVESAAFELLQALSPARVRAQSEVVTVEAGDTRMPLRQETLIAVQTRLNELGFSAGTADGIFGDQTSNAIGAFQEERGLAETGVPDPATILGLLVPSGDVAELDEEDPADMAEAEE